MILQYLNTPHWLVYSDDLLINEIFGQQYQQIKKLFTPSEFLIEMN